jgi:hypothetical protein
MGGGGGQGGGFKATENDFVDESGWDESKFAALVPAVKQQQLTWEQVALRCVGVRGRGVRWGACQQSLRQIVSAGISSWYQSI